MAGPPSAADRARDRRLVAGGLVGLVGLSTALSAAYSGATVVEFALLGAAGILVGGLLVVALGGFS